jgi:hypothetical protein
VKLDRELQRQFLEAAAEAYPQRATHPRDDISEHDYFGNLLYLEELGLIEAGVKIGLNNYYSHIGFKATARGMDFLQDDGGYTAALRMVTVKFHEETIRSLIERRITESDADPTVKKEVLKELKAIPAEGLKPLSARLMEAGLNHLPNAMTHLQVWLHQLMA